MSNIRIDLHEDGNSKVLVMSDLIPDTGLDKDTDGTVHLYLQDGTHIILSKEVVDQINNS